MYTDNELFFPYEVIPLLKRHRGPAWTKLVEQVEDLPECHEETLAFMLMMTRINNCDTCETDSYRAMRGCAACALQTLRRYKGNDSELTDAFRQALDDIRAFAIENPRMGQFIIQTQPQGQR